MFLELTAHGYVRRRGRGSRLEEPGGWGPGLSAAKRGLSSEGKALQTLGERQEGALDWREGAGAGRSRPGPTWRQLL